MRWDCIGCQFLWERPFIEKAVNYKEKDKEGMVCFCLLDKDVTSLEPCEKREIKGDRKSSPIFGILQYYGEDNRKHFKTWKCKRAIKEMIEIYKGI